MVIAGQTLTAGKAAVGKPAETDPLPDLQPFGFIAEGNDRADYFMTGYERVLGAAPFVVEHRKIGVAEAAVRDLDLNFLGAEFTGIEAERFQWSFRRGRGVGRSPTCSCAAVKAFNAARRAASRPCSTERFSPRRPEIASLPLTIGSVPLKNSSEPACDASTYAPKGVGGFGRTRPSSRRREPGFATVELLPTGWTPPSTRMFYPLRTWRSGARPRQRLKLRSSAC